MQRTLLLLFALALAAAGVRESQAQNPRQNPGLPKVDYQVNYIKPLGQGLAIHVKNGGFEMSPKTTVSVAIYNAQTRQLLMTKSLDVPAMQPNAARRVIVAPPQNVPSVMVKATIDPGNRVKETNERNNVHASRH